MKSSDEELIQVDPSFEVGEVTVLTIDTIFIAVVVEMITSDTCKVNVFKEQSLRFKFLEQRSVSVELFDKNPRFKLNYDE